MKLMKTVPVANVLGECVLWDERGEAFWWTDIHGRKLFRYEPSGDALSQFDTPERIGSFGFIEGEEGALIAAFESGLGIYRFATAEVEWLARPEAGVSGTRFNDGRVDRQGRFWAGTMVEGDGALDAAGQPVLGSVYRLDERTVDRVVEGVRITNSLCWSLDSRRLYFADSPEHTIFMYDFDSRTGEATNRRVFSRTLAPAEPDGSCVDADDHLWNARWGAGEVARHRPDGSVDLVLALPVSQPTCVCFGGPELSWLAVTSARDGLSDAELAAQPLAGALFLFETDYRGVPESRYIRDRR